MRTFASLLVLGLAAGCADQRDLTAPSEPATTPKPDLAAIELDVAGFRHNIAHTALSGGATTVFDATSDAFSIPSPNLAGARLARHVDGDDGFEQAFIATPGASNSGLGPVFDNESCEGCHARDGRGRPPVAGESFASLLFRSSIIGRGPHGGPLPVPGLGTQLQLRAVPGFGPDAVATLSYHDSTGTFGDGTTYHLQVPEFVLTGGRGPLPPGVLLSPRVAPVVFGLGLLEAVPELEVLALSIAQRATGVISGRPNYVWDEVRQRIALGRFGWKANTPGLLQQTAGAYNGDMGITSSLFPAESCEGVDPICDRHAPEVEDETVDDVAFYTRTLGVPARRDIDDPVNQRGEVLFHQSGCGSCHVATLRTSVMVGIPEVSNQVIHPYTDLLVHDMGPALADNRPDFLASGQEWRTAPLWGIGLVQTVNGHTNFLHDGRARSILEAVLWHGGEATQARDRVKRLTAVERAALIAFLSSL